MLSTIFLANLRINSLIKVFNESMGGISQSVRTNVPAIASTGTSLIASTTAKQAGDFQYSHVTAMDRYPELYGLAHDLWAKHPIAIGPPYLLSYGASTGREAVTLATKYFNHSMILGIDIDEPTLTAARDFAQKNFVSERVHFINGKKVHVDEKFHMIFANSVLCYHPNFNVKRFPFEAFTRGVGQLTRLLKPRGYLFVYNPSYRLWDTNFSKCWERAGSLPGGCGFVPLHDTAGKPLPEGWSTDCVFQKTNTCE